MGLVILALHTVTARTWRWKDPSMITQDNIVSDLLTVAPEAAETVLSHLEDQNGKPLIHLLMADLRRLAHSGSSTPPTVAARLRDCRSGRRPTVFLSIAARDARF